MKPTLHILSGLQLGGVEVAALYNFKRNWVRLNLKIVVIGSERDADALLDGITDALKARIIFLNYKKPIKFLKNLIKLVNGGAEKVIVSLWKSVPIGLLISKICSANYISFIHSETTFHFLDYIFTWISIKFSNVVFADSITTKAVVARRYSVKVPIIAVPHYLGCDERPKIYSKSFMEKNTIEFVYAGRISKEKNIEKTIDFLKELEKYGRSFTFNIYGPRSSYCDRIQEYFKSQKFINGHLRYHGLLTREKLLIEIKKYDIYVQTSPNEGMAISVLDAMSVGMVCLVVPSGEIRRYGQHMKNIVAFDKDNNENLKNLHMLYNINTIEIISRNAHVTCKKETCYDEAFAMAILNN